MRLAVLRTGRSEREAYLAFAALALKLVGPLPFLNGVEAKGSALTGS